MVAVLHDGTMGLGMPSSRGDGADERAKGVIHKAHDAFFHLLILRTIIAFQTTNLQLRLLSPLYFSSLLTQLDCPIYPVAGQLIILIRLYYTPYL